MDRSNTISSISTIARCDHGACLWALAYLVLDLDQERLEGLLSGLEEFRRVHVMPDHFEAYRERWGRVPDGRG